MPTQPGTPGPAPAAHANADELLARFQAWRALHPKRSNLTLEEWWNRRVELGLVLHGDPTFDQTDYRIRSGDGETLNADAGWAAALNTQATISQDTVFRVRIAVDETAGNNQNNNFSLEYRIDTGGGFGSWTAISGTTPIQWAASGQYADADATTQVITTGGTFQAGDGNENDVTTSNWNQSSATGEWEFALTLDSGQVNANDTIEVRMIWNGTATFNYTVAGASILVGAADTTVTPATVAAIAAVPGPTIQAAATVTPTAVAAIADAPTPTAGPVLEGLTETGQFTTAVLTESGARVFGNVVTEDGQIVFGLVADTDTTVTPATVAAVGDAPGPSLSAGATIVPATVAAVGDAPGPTAQAASTVTPAVVAAVADVLNPTILAASTVTPAAVAAIADAPTPTISAGALITPAVVAAIADAPTPTISVGGTPAVVTPAVVPITAAVPGPTIQAAATLTPAVVAAIADVLGPSILAGSTITPAVVAAVADVPAPTAQAGATVTPAVVPAVADAPTPTILLPAVVTPAVTAAIADVLGPNLIIPANVSPATVAAVVAIPLPTTDASGGPLAKPAILVIFYRNPGGNLVWSFGQARGMRRGFRTSEGHEVASEKVRIPVAHYRDGSADAAIAAAWAANSGAPIATLKAAINQALQDAGYRGPGGVDLV